MTAVHRAATTREVVLDAALAVFTEHTYGGTAMAQVADRAGVAVGSIYRTSAARRRWATRSTGGGRGACSTTWCGRPGDGSRPVREEFGAMWRALRAYATDHPAAFAPATSVR